MGCICPIMPLRSFGINNFPVLGLNQCLVLAQVLTPSYVNSATNLLTLILANFHLQNKCHLKDPQCKSTSQRSGRSIRIKGLRKKITRYFADNWQGMLKFTISSALTMSVVLVLQVLPRLLWG